MDRLGPFVFWRLNTFSSPTFNAKLRTLGKAIENWFLPVFGTKALGGITTIHIEAYREIRRLEPGLQGSSLMSSLNRDLALLKHLFSYAVREGWLEKNPVSRIKLEKENNARDRVLDPEEFTRLQAHSTPHLQAVNLMAY